MKFYLITSGCDNSECVPEKYLESAQAEDCVYTRHTPVDYIDNPPPHWYQDSREKFNMAISSSIREYDNKGVKWVEFDYPGKRYFIQEGDIDLGELIELSGGQVNLYGRGMANSTRFFEEEECEVFFGSPDIGDNMVLEFVDDGLEQILLDFSKNSANNK